MSLNATILALLLAITTANALQCYKCDSSKDVKCNWPITSFLYDTEDCGALASLVGSCYKIIAKDKDNKEYIARGCLTAGGAACNSIAKAAGFLSGLDSQSSITDVQCSVCDSDKCNSAVTTKITLFGLVLVVVAFLM